MHEDLYELYIVRHFRLEAYQAISDAFFNIQEYSKKDLHSPTAQVPRLLRYRSRADDVITLSNGRKKFSKSLRIPKRKRQCAQSGRRQATASCWALSGTCQWYLARIEVRRYPCTGSNASVLEALDKACPNRTLRVSPKVVSPLGPQRDLCS